MLYETSRSLRTYVFMFVSPLSIGSIMPKRDYLLYNALQFVTKKGDEGLLQSELWRKLGASSREGSRIAIKLEKKGLIRRERELFEGRWTYRLYPTRQPATVDSISDCPCLMCPSDSRCTRWSVISPNDCEKLNIWIKALVEESVN
jgi:hypothetical protein